MTQKELDNKKQVMKNAYKSAKSAVIKGNMFMLAIGILLGAAFGAVVSSLANDVIMPAIAKAFIGTSDLSKWEIKGIYIGKFLAALINFIIISLCIFITLLIVFTIKNAIEYKKALKQPIVKEEIKPTNEELILDELKKINANLQDQNAQKNSNK